MWPFSKSEDPLDNLDPQLREFLEKEAPKPSTHAAYKPPKAEPTTPRLQTQSQIQEDTPTQTAESDKPRVPPQSQFQDGRYAHLWKSYRPGETREALSDGEVLQNLTKAYNWRKTEISKTALENCVFDAIAEQECFKRGSFGQKIWLCRDETQALDRCTTMQAKFLQALGYMSVEGRPPETEERIQMHADRLYQQMLEHEKIAKHAKEQGLPAPEFKPIMSKDNLAKILGVQSQDYLPTAEKAEQMAQRTDMSYVPEKMREKYQKQIKDMTPDERIVEEAAQIAAAREQSNLANEYRQFRDQKKLDEEQRRKDGTLTVAERIRSLWWKEEKDK